MKTTLKAMMACTMIFAIATFTSCTKEDTSAAGLTYSISGNATGAQMVPSVTTNGTGTITGTYDPSTRQMTYTTGWAGLSGAPTTGGFYNGASGTAGTAIGSGWTMGTGLTGTGSMSGSTTLSAADQTALMNGNWYYSMGTAANGGGEVRGQMLVTANQ